MYANYTIHFTVNWTWKEHVFLFFFYQNFLLQGLMIHRTAGEGRGPSFIPLYHFHLLTNIQVFICTFACEMTINRSACVYQTATRWDLPPYWITIWLIDLWCELTNQVCYFYIRKNIFSCLFSIHNTINLSHREQVCLTRLRFEGYFSHHPIIHDFNIKKIVYW